MNSEVRGEVARKWRSYKYNKQHCKRGSAHSLPAGLHSMLSSSRMYNGGGGHRGSLSSGSGITSPCGQIEFNIIDIQTVSKHLNDQKLDTANWKCEKRPSLTQEIILNHCHCNGDSICFNSTCRQISQMQNELPEHAERTIHISYDAIDSSEVMSNGPGKQKDFLNSSYQKWKSADSVHVGQNGYATVQDDFCSSSKWMVGLGVSRST